MHRDSGKSKTRQGQSTPPHVRFYANDWFTGVAALKADERGVYISICVHIWTTGQRVPLDDAEAARRLCLQFNLYQRVRDKLLRLEKITKNIDGYGNHRAETELDRATNARSEAGNGVPTDSRPDARNGYDGRPEPDVAGCSKQGGAPTHSASGSTVDAHAATDSALLGAHGGACQGDPMGACQGEDEKTESNQSPSIEPRTKNQEPVNPPKAPKTFDGYERVKVEGGRIELFNGLKSFWLEKFGNDEERLALALLEAMPNLNPNSRTPLEAQIGRILARTVGEKRDRDQRYAAAVVANAARQPAKPKFKPSRW